MNLPKESLPQQEMARKRLMRDFKKLKSELATSGKDQTISAAPEGDDIFSWKAMICGPEDTPWKGGIFSLDVKFCDSFPNKAPKVKFTNKMFHPNIYMDGQICLDILHNQWSPIYDISAILTSIQSLLTDPNPNSPANMEAAQLWNENRDQYNKRVMEVVEATFESDGEDMDDEDDEEDVDMDI